MTNKLCQVYLLTLLLVGTQVATTFSQPTSSYSGSYASASASSGPGGTGGSVYTSTYPNGVNTVGYNQFPSRFGGDSSSGQQVWSSSSSSNSYPFGVGKQTPNSISIRGSFSADGSDDSVVVDTNPPPPTGFQSFPQFGTLPGFQQFPMYPFPNLQFPTFQPFQPLQFPQPPSFQYAPKFQDNTPNMNSIPSGGPAFASSSTVLGPRTLTQNAVVQGRSGFSDSDEPSDNVRGVFSSSQSRSSSDSSGKVQKQSVASTGYVDNQNQLHVKTVHNP